MVSTYCCAGTSFAFFLLTFALFLVCFGAPNWVIKSDGENYGLWRYCINDRCGDMVNESTPAYFKVVQGLMCASLVLTAVALGAYIGWMVSASSHKTVRAFRIANGFTTLGGLFTGISMTLFGVEYRYESNHDLGSYGWAFWVGVASAPLQIFVGAITACAAESSRDAEERAAANRSSMFTRRSGSLGQSDYDGAPGYEPSVTYIRPMNSSKHGGHQASHNYYDLTDTNNRSYNQVFDSNDFQSKGVHFTDQHQNSSVA